MSDDSRTVAAAYEHCRKIARAAARNFYYGFMLLPAAKRDALCALYAFMRDADDISDEPGEIEDKKRRLSARRAEMDAALDGRANPNAAANPVWIALRHAVEKYRIPRRYLHDLISGAEMDLTISSYETFAALREYCYRVAGAVGLCCLYVFEFEDPAAPELAEKMGIAFQLTNILRDLRRDYAMGRVYLPDEDFRKFGCAPADLAREAHHGAPNAALDALIQFEAERAARFYQEAWPMLEMAHADSRGALWAMATIYSGILGKIRTRSFATTASSPARLTTPEKIWVLVRARMGWMKTAARQV